MSATIKPDLIVPATPYECSDCGKALTFAEAPNHHYVCDSPRCGCGEIKSHPTHQMDTTWTHDFRAEED